MGGIFSHRDEYELVAQDEPESSAASASSSRGRCQFRTLSLDILVKWSMYIIFLCVVLNAFALSFAFYKAGANRNFMLQSDLDQLDWRSSYIGLDALYRDLSYPRPSRPSIVNHARLVAHVSSVRPTDVLPVKPTYKLVPPDMGYALVNKRHLLVTSEVSTIAQFRVLDWGMENCTVDVVIPQQSTNATTVSAIDNPTVVEIWSLDASAMIDTKTLSWSTKPKRRERIGNLTVASGTSSRTAGFACATLSSQTIEIACSGTQCALDVLHTGFTPEGFYIRQWPTV
ncbi:hypothetical protein OF83DRAFT_246820 [Amylostereum chailletii]|nr:hypothetical protein OF83DRAFT_246820 [Amylostereum chailletii]